MKFAIDKKHLLRAMSAVHAATDRKGTIPILQNVKIKADGDTATFTGTNMDMESTVRVPAIVTGAADITAPAQILLDIARKAATPTIEIATESDTAVTVRSGPSRFVLPTLPAVDFPTFAEAQWTHIFEIGAGDLLRLFERSRHAICPESSRYYLGGIFLHTTDAAVPMLRAVATDGHRLARIETPPPDGARGMPGLIVPRATVAAVIRQVNASDTDTITVRLTDLKIQFQIGQSRITSEVIDGTFPDYDRVIPTANNKLIELATEHLLDAIERVSTISSKKTKCLEIAMGAGLATLSMDAASVVAANEEIEAEWTGDPLTICFNASYLRDTVREMGVHTRIAIADPGSPAVLTDPDAPGALYVIMPMR